MADLYRVTDTDTGKSVLIEGGTPRIVLNRFLDSQGSKARVNSKLAHGHELVYSFAIKNTGPTVYAYRVTQNPDEWIETARANVERWTKLQGGVRTGRGMRTELADYEVFTVNTQALHQIPEDEREHYTVVGTRSQTAKACAAERASRFELWKTSAVTA